jgi:hypothetical protein
MEHALKGSHPVEPAIAQLVELAASSSAATNIQVVTFSAVLCCALADVVPSGYDPNVLPSTKSVHC